MHWSSKAGVLNPRATDGYQPTACWEPGCKAGGERPAIKASLTLPPEPFCPAIHGKIVFHETGAKNVGDPCSKGVHWGHK